MYSKAKIFNLALGALLLQRKITNTDTDTSNECNVLNTHWESALRTALREMDLDSTSVRETLELIEEDPIDAWLYAYKYPSDCAFLRRIESAKIRDTRSSHVAKLVRMHGGQKVIFSNQYEAVAEYISHDLDLSTITGEQAMAIAYKLAFLSAPLITGKGARELRKSIQVDYKLSVTAAQEADAQENFNFDEDDESSEFVEERMS